MTQLGVIGLGLLGSAMSERFMAAGYIVVGFDSSAERREQFRAAGGVVCDSAKAVFQNCDTVGPCVATTRCPTPGTRDAAHTLL